MYKIVLFWMLIVATGALLAWGGPRVFFKVWDGLKRRKFFK